MASSNKATTVLLRLPTTQTALLKSYEVALNLMEYVVLLKFPRHFDGPHKLRMSAAILSNLLSVTACSNSQKMCLFIKY